MSGLQNLRSVIEHDWSREIRTDELLAGAKMTANDCTLTQQGLLRRNGLCTRSPPAMFIKDYAMSHRQEGESVVGAKTISHPPSPIMALLQPTCSSEDIASSPARLKNSPLFNNFALNATIPFCSAEDVTQHSCSAEDVALPSCSAEDVAQPSCSGEDVTLFSCSAMDVDQPSCSAVDVALPSCSAVDVALPSCSAEVVALPSCSAEVVALPSCSAEVVALPS
ncbi:hypothetical protein AMELA_G00157620, partial [Ameiurus melas]